MNRKNYTITFAVVSALVAMVVSPLRGDVKLPAVFGDHMVLQQEMPSPVWGDAAAGEKVSVAFAGQTVSTEADANGKWSLKLAPLKANAQPGVFAVQAKNTITIQDVLVGEVWFSSGQSNMAMEVKAAANAADEIAAAKYPAIRWFMIEPVNAENPLTDTKGTWQVCSPAIVGDLSAAAYFFARDLHGALKQPVGMVHGACMAPGAGQWSSGGRAS